MTPLRKSERIRGRLLGIFVARGRARRGGWAIPISGRVVVPDSVSWVLLLRPTQPLPTADVDADADQARLADASDQTGSFALSMRL